MTDKFKIDSHKLNYHPERVSQWLNAGNDWEKAKKIYPIYIEVSPSNSCNHRCIFCGFDYLGYKPENLNPKNYLKAIDHMSAGGVKSILYSGEGEPLLHPQISEFVTQVKAQGIDVAVATNGVLLQSDFLKKALSAITWLKISLDAGTPETHSKIHQTKKEDFNVILENLKKAVTVKKQKNLKTTLGVQMLLLPENHAEAVPLAKILQNIGVDYLVIKPYSQHLMSVNKQDIDYNKYLYLEDELDKLSNGNFQVIFRRQTMEKTANETRDYPHCQATPVFWAHLMTNGDVYGCSSFLGNDKFRLGNINKNSFKEIWEGEARRKNWEFVKNLNINACRQNCRMDKVNQYLWNLKNPPEHVNFI